MTPILTERALAVRVDSLPWTDLADQLDRRGFAVTEPLLDERECADARRPLRRRPLPLHRSTWPGTASATAATATSTTRSPSRSPSCAAPSTATSRRSPTAGPACSAATRTRSRSTHEELLARCHAAGQERPTPLILRYGEGDWNALHQDLYGDVYFPFQVLTVLSEQGEDYEGGQFVLMEQRPRAQSRAHVITPPRGAFVIFPTQVRPNAGKRGYHRVGLRHGVSTVTAGQRTAMGLIFHDAR